MKNTPSDFTPPSWLSGGLRNKLSALLASIGLLSPAPQAQGEKLATSTEIAQSGSPVVEGAIKNVASEVKVIVPEETLSAQAMKIFEKARAKKGFASIREQNDFFHLCSAIEQDVPLGKEFFIEYNTGTDNVNTLSLSLVRKLKIDRDTLKGLIVNP